MITCRLCKSLCYVLRDASQCTLKCADSRQKRYLPFGVMAELFEDLESNDPAKIELAKQTLHMQLNQQRDSWILNGLYDKYLKTNSVRYVDVLVNVVEPHHNHLFDKVSESIHGNKYDEKVQALTLLGHIVRRQTPWLFKITEHKLLKELMRLLKVETDILPLLSALLVLIILLPIIPSHIGQFLEEIFVIFSRLAAWNCHNPEKLVEEQMVHMQVALYALFQRLYGMYPCNFLAYLRNQYKDKELSPIFSHTVKPMLSTVKMHPLLVTISKDSELTTERWKKMNSLDVIVDCERFTLGIFDHCIHESCLGAAPFRSRSGTTNSVIFESPVPIQNFRNIPMGNVRTENFSPSTYFPEIALLHNSHIVGPNLINLAAIRIQSQEGTSPPEAAIEATPETTPIKDTRTMMSQRSSVPQSQVPRALTSFPNVGGSKVRPVVGGIAPMAASSATTTPTHSQPSSPMRKDHPQIHSHGQYYTSAFGVNKVHKMLQERSQAIDCDQPQALIQRTQQFLPTTTISPPVLPHRQPLPHHYQQHQQQQPPSSPFRNIEPSATHFPSIAGGFGTGFAVANLRIESPVSSQEDQEVVAIVSESGGGGDLAGGSGGRGSTLGRHPMLRQCDSVIHDTVEGGRATATDDDLILPIGADYDLSQGSPCSAGGLHMLDSTVINKYVERLRYHSQCGSGNESYETGLDHTISPTSGTVPSLPIPKVRRANSCPEIKKLPTTSSKDAVVQKPLDETDEDITEDKNNLSNGVESDTAHRIKKVQMSSIETQTESFWPYEHLFLSIFPSSDQSEAVRPSPANSPLPIQSQHVTNAMIYANTNDILNRYIEVALNNNERDALKHVKSQLHLLYQQLLFERHHRESHACGNRRLLAESRSNRALEEHNSALRDQVQLHQRDIDKLKEQVEVYKKQQSCSISKDNDDAYHYKSSCRNFQLEIKQLKEQNSQLVKQLQSEKSNSSDLEKSWKVAEDKLFHAQTEVKISQEQIWAGQKCREELERVNTELLLCGELIERYKEYVAEIPLLKQSKSEIGRVSKVYLNEVRQLQNQLDNRQVLIEAYRSRIGELEHELIRKFDASSEEKRSLNHAQEEYDEKIKAVQSKYHTLMSINRSLEEKLLFYQQEDLMNSHKRGGGIHSPDTSSCHEVNPTPSITERGGTGGGAGGVRLSPHSSPLSASLASSSEGGSVGFLYSGGGTGSDGRGEVKNLQLIVDRAEPPTPTTASSTNPFGTPGTPEGDDMGLSPLNLGDALLSDMQQQQSLANQQQHHHPTTSSSNNKQFD